MLNGINEWQSNRMSFFSFLPFSGLTFWNFYFSSCSLVLFTTCGSCLHYFLLPPFFRFFVFCFFALLFLSTLLLFWFFLFVLSLSILFFGFPLAFLPFFSQDLDKTQSEIMRHHSSISELKRSFMESVPEPRPSEWDKRLSTHSPFRTASINGQVQPDAVGAPLINIYNSIVTVWNVMLVIMWICNKEVHQVLSRIVVALFCWSQLHLHCNCAPLGGAFVVIITITTSSQEVLLQEGIGLTSSPQLNIDLSQCQLNMTGTKCFFTETFLSHILSRWIFSGISFGTLSPTFLSDVLIQHLRFPYFPEMLACCSACTNVFKLIVTILCMPVTSSDIVWWRIWIIRVCVCIYIQVRTPTLPPVHRVVGGLSEVKIL